MSASYAEPDWYGRIAGVAQSAFGAVMHGFKRPEGWDVFDAPGALPPGMPSISKRPDIFFALSPGGADSTAVRRFIESSPTLSAIKKVSGPQDLADINAYINGHLRYSDDEDVGPRYQPPSEMIANGRGDCEDFAIMKYHALRAMGVPAKDMVLLAYADKSGLPVHIALAVRLGEHIFVMDDNRNGSIASLALHRDYVRKELGGELSWSLGADHTVRRVRPDADYVQEPPRPLDKQQNIVNPHTQTLQPQ